MICEIVKIDDDETSNIIPVKHIIDVVTMNTNSHITSSLVDNMDEEINLLEEEEEYDPFMSNDDIDNDLLLIHDDQRQHDQPEYFEIRSMVHIGTNVQHGGWCLQEAFQSTTSSKKKKKNLIMAAVCDGSPSQKWILDHRGLLHNQNQPNKCLKRLGKSFKVDDCSTKVASKLKWMKWILSSDGTIRWANNALIALVIPDRYTSSSMLKKTVAPLVMVKLANRFPKVNEQWMIFTPEPETMAPSPNPTAHPTVQTTVYPTPSITMFPTPDFNKPHNNPGNETSNAPFMSPNFPTPSHTSVPSLDFHKPDNNPGNETSNAPFISPNFPTPGDDDNDDDDDDDTTKPPPSGLFNISLINMGSDNTYDEPFQKAKEKLEKIVIGDVQDQMARNYNPDHDWFGNFWPDHKMNVFVDDVLIGYEIGEIDGRSKILGYAGPRYIRRSVNSLGVESVTTISG